MRSSVNHKNVCSISENANGGIIQTDELPLYLWKHKISSEMIYNKIQHTRSLAIIINAFYRDGAGIC